MNNDKFETCILFTLAKAYQRVQGIFKSRFQPLGLTPMQLLVLECLYEEEGLSSGEIGKRLVLDSATLSGVLDRMDEGGWIIKNYSYEDRRLLQVRLTEKSLQLKKEILNEYDVVNQEVMSSFTMEEKVILYRILKDLRK
jgi:DNA-binding MarR family transcriptional regulator